MNDGVFHILLPYFQPKSFFYKLVHSKLKHDTVLDVLELLERHSYCRALCGISAVGYNQFQHALNKQVCFYKCPKSGM